MADLLPGSGQAVGVDDPFLFFAGAVQGCVFVYGHGWISEILGIVIGLSF